MKYIIGWIAMMAIAAGIGHLLLTIRMVIFTYRFKRLVGRDPTPEELQAYMENG